MKQMKPILGILAIALAQPALADSTASAPLNTSTSSSSSGLLETIKKNAKANYLFELTGPSAQALSGNTDGTGTNLKIIHYPAVGTKLGGKWNVMATQPLQQVIDEKEEDSADAPNAFTALDPYVSFNNSRIAGSSYFGFNLSSQLRYYVPISKGTHNAVNDASVKDTGNGRIRAMLNPGFSFMDGALSVEAPTYFYYRFARRTNAERTAKNGSGTRQDYSVLPTLITAYQTTKTVQPYLELGMLLNHSTNGRWTKTDDAENGLYISPGANINVGKSLTLIPAASVGPYAFNVKKASFSLQALYVFL